MPKTTGTVIFMNGASSSGKTTLAKKLQSVLSEPYFHISIDTFLHQLPDACLGDDGYLSRELPRLLVGFNASSAAMARVGINVIIDHVLQEPEWIAPCVREFKSVKVVFVAVRCPLDVLEIREQARRDRRVGLARYQYDRVHSHDTYDVEVDTSTMSVDEGVLAIREYVESDRWPTAFEKLREMRKS